MKNGPCLPDHALCQVYARIFCIYMSGNVAAVIKSNWPTTNSFDTQKTTFFLSLRKKTVKKTLSVVKIAALGKKEPTQFVSYPIHIEKGRRKSIPIRIHIVSLSVCLSVCRSMHVGGRTHFFSDQYFFWCIFFFTHTIDKHIPSIYYYSRTGFAISILWQLRRRLVSSFWYTFDRVGKSQTKLRGTIVLGIGYRMVQLSARHLL